MYGVFSVLSSILIRIFGSERMFPLSEISTLNRIEESIDVYFKYMQSLFGERRYLEVTRVHQKFSESVKPEWFLSPVGPQVPELELMCLESHILGKITLSIGTGRACKYLESVLSKSFIDQVETHSGGGAELLEGALSQSARTALSQIAFLLSEQFVSEDKKTLRFLLVAVHMLHANVSAWERLLTGWLISDADKFRLVRSVRWDQTHAPVAQYAESLVRTDNSEIPSIRFGATIDRFSLNVAFRRALLSPSIDELVALVNRTKPHVDALVAVAPLSSIALYLIGDSATLFTLASKLLKECPDDTDAFFVGGVYYLSVHKFDIARKFFSRAKGSVHGWLGYGLAFAMSDESGHAINAFRSATISFPKCVLPWLYAGMECIRTNELKLAQSFLISALGLCGTESTYNEDRFRPLILNEIGLICLKAEQFDIAAENLQLCCSASGRVTNNILSVFYSNFGHALVKVRDVDGALKAFEVALSHNSNNGNALAGLGFCHHCKGNLSKAIDLYSASLYQISGNRKIENLVNNLIQMAVNEYSFSVKQSAVLVPSDEDAITSF
jgi:hypothetical protein